MILTVFQKKCASLQNQLELGHILSVEFGKYINNGPPFQPILSGPTLSTGSFDIESLFINIPLDETIDICMNQLFENINNVERF